MVNMMQGQPMLPDMGGMGGVGGAPSILDLMQGLMGGTAPIMQTPQTAELTSPLDMWTMANYGMIAEQLDENQRDDLIGYVMTMAEDDRKFWKPRDDRMLDSQSFWELGSRYANSTRSSIESGTSLEDDPDEVPSEQVEFNDGYLTVDKITSMVESAGWGFDVQPRSPEMDDVAQNIENALRWMDEELDEQHGKTLHGTINRDEIHYAALRGWITGMILPNPKNRYMPLRYVLEDPLFVYPRYNSSGLTRVTHQYTMLGLEAKGEFPAASEFLNDRKDDEEISVVDYYDDVYRMTLLNGDSVGGSSITPKFVLQPLTRHGYVDMQGRPINPWMIVTPRGSPTRRIGKFRGKADQDKLVAFIGLDVLYPIKDMIVTLEKLASMMFTEIGKGVAPTLLVYYDGHNKPEPINIGAGMQNYLIFQAEDAKILDTTAMKPDTGPFLQLVTDRLQRGAVPAVLYGQAGFALAGYAINLLSQGANDVVRPLLNGIKLYRKLKYKRMLEMYAGVAAQWMPTLNFPRYDKEKDVTYSGGATLSVEDIRNNGANVNVSYDEVMPKDAAVMIPTVVGAMQAGLLPIYDAMKQAGVKDPRQAMRRLAEGKNFEDPLVMKHLARLAGMSSGNELLKAAIIAAQMEEQFMIQQQQAMMAAEASGKNPIPQPGGGQARGRNTEESPPAATNPITASVNQASAVAAENNVGNGASMPSGETIQKRTRQRRRV